MNLVAVTNKLQTLGGPKVQLAVAKVNKFSPQILTGVGIVGGISATFLIARATLKLEDLMNDFELGKQIIEANNENGMYATPKAHKKAMTALWAHTVLQLAKLYGPGVSLGAASVLAVAAGQGIAQKRQVGLVAALKSAESTLQAYRARVIEAIGEEKEGEVYYGLKTETIEDGDGKKLKVKSFDPTALSPYSRVFDEDNKNWERGNRELNFLFLTNIQNWANDRLNSRGFVYLNEVYDWLGMKKEPAGQVVGWLHRDFNNGDGYIDFGWDNPVNNASGKKIGDMANGIVLDFNIDGEINSKL